ncbi:MAG TPA: aspartate aminotransferase family protein [Candidatus Tectomicrobia bacterium]|nr:aspartate aminotransferase family protein [Candidatus Tectomicrobia bacterium]
MSEAMETSLHAWYRDDLSYILHPATALKAHNEEGPKILVEGHGIYVKDLEGRQFIDGLAGLWNVNIGHGRTEIGDVVREQIGKLAFAPSFFGFSNLPSIALAKRLIDMTPPHLTRVFYTSGGSESNESALKIVRYYFKLNGQPQRFKIISRNQAYHGVSMGALSATGIQGYRDMAGPLVPGFSFIPAPYCYRCELGLNYPSCELACAKALEHKLEAEGPETVAAFIGEPVMGAGGAIVPPPEYWPTIEAICRKYGVLLILDEVITGFGRTGKRFALEHWDLRPDMLSLAKGISSGYVPLGASIITEEIYRALLDKAPPAAPFPHGFTYNGHPVACVAALKNLDIMQEEHLIEQAAEVGAYFQERLRVFREHPLVGDVRGMGLIAGVELVRDKASRERFEPIGKAGAMVAQRAFEGGLICRAILDTVAFAPPLCITKTQVDEVLRIFAEALDRGQQELLDYI